MMVPSSRKIAAIGLNDPQRLSVEGWSTALGGSTGDVLPSSGLPSGQQFGEFESDMRYFVPRICSSNFYTALRIVAQTDALGFILPSFAAHEIEDGSIVVLPFKAPWAVTNYGIMYLRGRMLSPAAAAFRAAAVSAEHSYFSGKL
jgi:DNA-binding transcriptional LysR family regulator